jgi:murein endopeptidase
MRPRLASSLVLLILATATATAMGAGSAHAARFPAAWLPDEGEGYAVPPAWAERGLRYGTPELVGLIERAARTVADDVPGAVLYVGDLSLRDGGWTQWHRSHRNGCDADLIFFATDDDGEPAPRPSAMARFDSDGVAWAGETRLHFDTERNWALVRALVSDEDARVVRIFIAAPLRARLLAFAEEQGEPAELIAHAAEVLGQPGDSQPHDDHMHVRIAAPVGVEEIVPQRTYARAGKAAAHRGRGQGKPHARARKHGAKAKKHRKA